MVFYFSINSFSIPNYIRYEELPWIFAQIYFKNTSAAFIAPESNVETILGRDDMFENGQNVFRVIKFNVGKHSNTNEDSKE